MRCLPANEITPLEGLAMLPQLLLTMRLDQAKHGKSESYMCAAMLTAWHAASHAISAQKIDITRPFAGETRNTS